MNGFGTRCCEILPHQRDAGTDSDISPTSAFLGKCGDRGEKRTGTDMKRTHEKSTDNIWQGFKEVSAAAIDTMLIPEPTSTPLLGAPALKSPPGFLAYTVSRQITKINTSPVLQVVCYFPKNSRALRLSPHHIPRIRNEKNNDFSPISQNAGTFAQFFIQIIKTRPNFAFPGRLWPPL